MKRLTAMSLLTIFLTFAPAVIAQTPTRVRTASPSSEPRAETKDRVATRASEIRNQNLFITGKIVTIDGTTLMVNLAGGKTVSINTGTSTKFIDITSARKVITIKNLKVGDRIAVTGMGPQDSSGTAKVVLKIPAERIRVTLFGTITKVDIATGSAALKTATSSANVTLQQRIGTSSAVIVTKDTKLKIRGNSNPTIADLKIGQKAVVTGPKVTGAMTAFHFFVIGIDPKLTGNSQSASRSASPSARPTAKASTPGATNR